MNYWLMKTEPDTYSWDDLVRDGKTIWDGVRNYAARIHLREMKKGDTVFLYHSNVGKAIFGICKVQKEHFPDPSSDDPQWLSVEIIPDVPLRKPITLETIKADAFLKDMILVNNSRLSVQPVTKAQYDYILKLSEKM
ncbi:MAG: EVE domain-containing protein [Bacteroidetes bacterium]|nr:EVE domain-containing protein [Bacteroidota bacterium]